MKCAVHPEVDATGFCRNCGKAMCPVCARPVREVLYCENCLALGMGVPAVIPPPPAANPYAAPGYSAPGFVPPASPLPVSPGRPSGAVAFMLGLFPGLGAVYNGEYNKALIHLVVFTAIIFGLVEASNADDFSVGPVIVLAFMLAGFVFYMAFDAMRVAQAKVTGEQVSDPLNDFSKKLPVGPIILIGVGGMLLLGNFRVFQLLHINLWRLWPLVLIGVGFMMFRNRAGRS
ncbi:MAG TPA: DUF5668 domain-containing protein [Candidatus Acidoferrum sp.]|nr:DUF5668 domain-containing protein [Candidatus Acidoferrum sp.]